jgi:hypothetical protein
MQALSEYEIDILRRLVHVGGGSEVSSHQRLRLELLGAIKDGPKGIVVTALGRRLATQAPPPKGPEPTPSDVPRNSRGNRLHNRRGVLD